MQAFDLTDMAKLIDMTFAKAKNWTVGRPFTIPASAYQATGRGSINLYSLEDVYLMAVANEFSKVGFAAAAIGKLVEALRVKYPSLGAAPLLTVWRPKAGGKFEIAEDQNELTAVRVLVDVPKIVQAINQSAEKLARSRARKR